jgi:hypothetical protein
MAESSIIFIGIAHVRLSDIGGHLRIMLRQRPA